MFMRVPPILDVGEGGRDGRGAVRGREGKERGVEDRLKDKRRSSKWLEDWEG